MVSDSIYLSGVFEMPLKKRHGQLFMQYKLAERFGWTLDYINSLDEATLADLFGVMDGMDRLARRRRN